MGHVDHGKEPRCSTRSGRQLSSRARPAASPTYRRLSGEPAPTIEDHLPHHAGHEPSPRCAPVAPTLRDIVILVWRPMTGLKPQTIEAINHTKAAGVPMIVAINRSNKNGANPQKVREELLQHEIASRTWAARSGRRGFGAEEDQSRQIARGDRAAGRAPGVKANPDRAAEGAVVEPPRQGPRPLATRADPARNAPGGDIFVAGPILGKVRAMIDDHGRQVKEAGRACPSRCVGLSGVPSAGDVLSASRTRRAPRESPPSRP